MKRSGLKGDDAADPATMKPDTAGTEQENEELNWGRRHMGGDNTVLPQTTGTGHMQLVERVTALHDIGPAPGQEPVPAKKRSRDNRIRSCDDNAVRCMQARELSDRLEEVTKALLIMINDLQYRVDDLEATRHGAAQPMDKTRPGGRT